MPRNNFRTLNIAFFMALVLYSTPAFTAPDIFVSKAAGLPGDTVIINVDYVGDGAVVTLQLDILFNPSVLTPEAAISGIVTPHGLVSNVVEPGKIRLLVPPVLQNPLPDIATAHPIATIRFAISSNALQGSEILSISNLILGDASGSSVAAGNLSGGEIEILEAGLLQDVPMLSLWGLVSLIPMVIGFGVLGMQSRIGTRR